MRQFINPGESMDTEEDADRHKIKETPADALQARFYEVINTGTKNLEEATQILKPLDPTLQMVDNRVLTPDSR
jgi:hypothetical protein